jgi:hypothetical protein
MRAITNNLILILAAGWMMVAATGPAAWADTTEAPGLTMAHQATKSVKRWNTTDHAKHPALKQAFTSGRNDNILIIANIGAADKARFIPLK